ncbi:MAG TPA: DNA mismatch repair endonuclease MutL [Gemmatimonadales bacterium]|nr:DNA mismatch repair endonuclease MutL [Gemmatimonadales bacterium]
MGRVRILPDAVADQIAAGEVVERPASVVKELVENALDAGAGDVLIELEGGGRTRIRVSDDGAGMERDDAVLALDRHATSKIASAADLVGVATYGFRGEALPAIASVSHLVLETAPAGGPAGEGTRLVVRGGRLDDVSRTARRPGTTVTVERLFFNTPARRKFLRAPRSETRAAVEAAALLALARTDVTFRVESDGRALLDARAAGDLRERLGQILGRELEGELVPVRAERSGMTVTGFVQRPADARPAGRKTYLFVNGRPFRDPFLVRSAEAGYRGTLPPGLRPTLILRLTLAGDQVDVNVHPAKLEVRFRDRYAVERLVEDAVRAALGELVAAAVIRRGEEGEEGDEGEGSWPSSPSSPITAFDLADKPLPRRKLLQVFDAFLLLETPDGIAIIDQHSAHERILFERAMATLTEGQAAAQHLLLPATVRLGPEELDAVERHREQLATIGFEAEPFGGDAVILHAVPNPHRRFDAVRCFQEVAADLARGRFGALANRLERFAATFACRAAVKAGDRLEPAELDELVTRLFACTLPPHDVHGRPTIVQLSRVELERRFGRA